MPARSAPGEEPAAELVIADEPGRSRYEARLGGSVAAFSEYRLMRDGRVAVIHTVVDPAFGGRGVGSALARGLLDDIRARGLRVTPYCAFVRAYIERHPEYADLVTWGRHGGADGGSDREPGRATEPAT